MFVEGFGIPEGFGYYGLVQGVVALTGYKGPASGAYTIPTAGTAVEIDAANLMRIDNVHIADGGIGPGNAAFQCGMDESDPTNAIGGKSASIVFTNSRLDANPAFAAGPSNPDFALRLGASCHGSTYRNIAAYDGSKANVLQYNGNVLSQVHVDSSAVNATTPGAPAPTINWGTLTAFSNFGLVGAADYGVYVLGATTMAQTVCGIANIACIFTIPNPAAGSLDAGQITDTQMRCGGFASFPSGYFGVKIGSGAANTTVSGTASAGRCAVRPVQLVHLDDPANSIGASLSLCNNSNAVVAGCTGYQGPFAAGQFYTQPAVSYGTVAISGNVLYAVPFFSPASGGAITKLGLQVTTIGAASLCEVGVYYAAASLPTTLMLDGGALTVNNAGTLAPVNTGLSGALAPQTLYFLAVRCNGSVTFEGAITGGGFTTPLVGGTDLTHTSTQITAPGTFGSGALPATFNTGGAISSVAGPVPNVYAGP